MTTASIEMPSFGRKLTVHTGGKGRLEADAMCFILPDSTLASTAETFALQHKWMFSYSPGADFVTVSHAASRTSTGFEDAFLEIQ